MFAIGCKSIDVAFANQVPATRQETNETQGRFPCLILTGMGYKDLLGSSLETVESLRESEVSAPPEYMSSVPITFMGKVENPSVPTAAHDEDNEDSEILDDVGDDNFEPSEDSA